MSGQTSMMTFSQDIMNAEAPPPLPARSYRAEIVGAMIRPAQASGMPYLALQFRVPASEYPADYTEGDPDGTVLYYNRLQVQDTPRGRYLAKMLMQKLGGPLGHNIDCNALIGLWANIEVAHQERDGEMRENVTRILAP